MSEDDAARSEYRQWVTLLGESGKKIHSTENLAKLLREASRAFHPQESEFWRAVHCVLTISAGRLERLEKDKTIAEKYTLALRRERDEARDGIVNPDWWIGMEDDCIYGDPSKAFDDFGYGLIVALTGNATIEHIWGFRLGRAPGADDFNYREFWFTSSSEAERVLAATLAEDAAAQARLDANIKRGGRAASAPPAASE